MQQMMKRMNGMKMRIKRHSRKAWYLLLMILLFQGVPGTAQEQDLQGWARIQLEREVTGDLELALDLQQRMKGNLGVFDRSMITGKADYDLPAGFGISGGVRYQVVKDEAYYDSRYRLNGDLDYDYDLGALELGWRSRIQYGMDDRVRYEEIYDNKLVNRNRAGLSYHIFGTRFTPFGTVEIFRHLNREQGAHFYKMRYEVGVDLLLSTTSELEFFYKLEDEFNVSDPLLAHILGAGLTLKL